MKTRLVAHSQELYAFALHLTSSGPDAEDLVQATYARFFSRWRQVRNPDALRGWLFRVLRSIHLNEVTAHARRAELLSARSNEAAPSTSTRDSPRGTALSLDVEQALSGLSDAHRAVVLLADVWGFTYAEIALIEGCPEGTVRSRLHRARKELALALEDYAEVSPGAEPGTDATIVPLRRRSSEKHHD